MTTNLTPLAYNLYPKHRSSKKSKNRSNSWLLRRVAHNSIAANVRLDSELGVKPEDTSN